jgi:hypothetical protein
MKITKIVLCSIWLVISLVCVSLADPPVFPKIENVKEISITQTGDFDIAIVRTDKDCFQYKMKDGVIVDFKIIKEE